MVEIYSGLLIVAVTLAVSYFVYAEVRFPVQREPVYSEGSYSVYGTPAFLHLQVNASASSQAAQFAIDEASSSDGVLALSQGAYVTGQSLCGEGVTTFFSVNTTAGVLSVNSTGPAWVNGVEGSSANVSAGWNEVAISNSSSCAVTLPGGQLAEYPSPEVSAMPRVGDGSISFLFLVPYETDGHTVAVTFDGAVETYAF